MDTTFCHSTSLKPSNPDSIDSGARTGSGRLKFKGRGRDRIKKKEEHGAIPGQGLAFLFRDRLMAVFAHEKAQKKA
jgi:hypothetical protein